MKKIIYFFILSNLLLLTSCIDSSTEVRWNKEKTDWFPHHEGTLVFNNFLKKTKQKEALNFLIGFHTKDYPDVQGVVIDDYAYPSISQDATTIYKREIRTIDPLAPLPKYVSYKHTTQGLGLKFDPSAYNKRISIMATLPLGNKIFAGTDVSNRVMKVHVYSSAIFKTHKLVLFSPEIDLNTLLKPNESLDDYSISFGDMPYLAPFVERSKNNATDTPPKITKNSATKSQQNGYKETPKKESLVDSSLSAANYPINHPSVASYDPDSGKVSFNKKGVAHIILKRNALMGFESSTEHVKHHIVILHDFKPFATFSLMDDDKQCMKFEKEDIHFSDPREITRMAPCDLASVNETSIPNNKVFYGWNGSLYTYNRDLSKIYAEIFAFGGNKYFSGHIVQPHRGSDYFFTPYDVGKPAKWQFESKFGTEKYYLKTVYNGATLYVSHNAQKTPNHNKSYGTSLTMEESIVDGGAFTLNEFASASFYYLHLNNDAAGKLKSATEYRLNSIYPTTKMTYAYPSKVLQYKINFPNEEKSIPVRTPIGLLDPTLFWTADEAKIKIPRSRTAYQKNVFIDNNIIPYKNMKVLSVLPLDLKKTTLDSKYVESYFDIGIKSKNGRGSLMQISVHHENYTEVGNFINLGSGILKNAKTKSSKVKVSLNFLDGLGPNDFINPKKDNNPINVGKNGRISSFSDITFDFNKDSNIYLIFGYDLTHNYLYAGLADEDMVREKKLPNMVRIKVFPYIMEQLRDGFYTVIKMWNPGGASIDFNRPYITYGNASKDNTIKATQDPHAVYAEFILSMLKDPDLIFTKDFKTQSRIKVLVEKARRSILYRINHTAGGSVSNFGEDYRFDINRDPSADSIIGRGLWIAKYKEKYGDFPYHSLYFHKYVKKTIKEYAGIINSRHKGNKKSSLTPSGLYNFVFREGSVLLTLNNPSSGNGSYKEGGDTIYEEMKSEVIKKKILNFILEKAYRKASASIPSYFTNQNKENIIADYNKNVAYMGLWTKIYTDVSIGSTSITYGTKNYTPTYSEWIREIDLRMVGIGEKVKNWGPFGNYHIFTLHYVPSARATMATALTLLEKWFGKDYTLAFYKKNGHNGFKLYHASLNVLKNYRTFYFPDSKMGFDPGIMMGKIAQLYYMRAKDSMTYGVSHVDNNILKACDVSIPEDYLEDYYIIGSCLTYMMKADKRIIFNLQSRAISDWISGLDAEGPTFFQRFFKGFMYILNIVMAFDMAEAIMEGMESFSSTLASEDMVSEIEESGTMSMDLDALSDESLLEDMSVETQSMESEEVISESALTEINDGELVLEGCYP